ncbi:hypothetical protein [Halomonas sp. C05BenzN]|uniref:hypothetical protein n=1 Tax=Halomonas sp. C05BenzN TaxID=3411041 RepID=UPI003B966894
MAAKRRIRVLREEVQLSLDLSAPAPDERSSPPSARVVPFPKPVAVPDVPATPKEPEARQAAPLVEEKPFWSEQDIRVLREELLHHTLHQLGDPRVTEATKAEIRQWVASDEVGPFSFSICAGACGYDHEDLRERLHDLLDLVRS